MFANVQKVDKKEQPNRKDVDPSKPEDTIHDHIEVKNTGYDEAYIQALIDRARKNWSDVKDADEWLRACSDFGFWATHGKFYFKVR